MHAHPACAQLDDDQTRGFQAASMRLMGDMKEAGDAPFRGEVQLDSKVCLEALFVFFSPQIWYVVHAACAPCSPCTHTHRAL